MRGSGWTPKECLPAHEVTLRWRRVFARCTRRRFKKCRWPTALEPSRLWSAHRRVFAARHRLVAPVAARYGCLAMNRPPSLMAAAGLSWTARKRNALVATTYGGRTPSCSSKIGVRRIIVGIGGRRPPTASGLRRGIRFPLARRSRAPIPCGSQSRPYDASQRHPRLVGTRDVACTPRTAFVPKRAAHLRSTRVARTSRS